MTTTPTRIQPYGLADLDLLPPGAVAALLGDAVHLATELSPITHVDASTAPTFVWATAQDGPGLPNALAWSCTSIPREATGWVWPMESATASMGGWQSRTPRKWSQACRRWLTDRGVLDNC